MKVVMALLVTTLILLASLGGYYYYNQYKEKMGQAQMVQASSSNSSSGEITMGELKKPENDADVLEELYSATKQNRDTVAWLQIKGTDINDSVMQSMDNIYYERRNEYKKDDIYGCYFADYECPLGMREEFALNTVIYGHSDLQDNPDGPKFSQLFRFTDLAFAKKTPYIYLTTQDGGKITWQIFAAFFTDTSLNYINIHLEPNQALELANEAIKRSVYDYGIQPEEGDKLLTLSTCSIKDGNDGTHRFVVMARQMPQDYEEQSNVEVKQR